MSSSITEVLGTIQPDGTLRLDQKLTAPPGRVRVRIEAVEIPVPPTESLSEFIERTRKEMTAAGSRFMTEEEVTAWIEELRADDDRLEQVYRQADEAKHPQE